MAHIFGKKWRSKDVRLREKVDFSALLLNERVLEGLQKAGFKRPSPIQFEAIPVGKFGQDLVVQAKSGTGKTLVFVVIALEVLKRKLYRPQVLVVVPTREIATQVCSVVKAVGSAFPKLTCNSFIGGLPLFNDQEIAASTQIVVGTPGRLKQLIQLKSLPPTSIRLLIFDEADELLNNNSFKEDIEDIFCSLPDDKQVIATSATYNLKVKKLLYRFLSDPNLVRLNVKDLALLGIVHYAQIVEFCPMPLILYRNKLQVLQKILKSVKFAQCLLFCNGIQRVEVLYKDVKKWGFSAAYISSAKEQFDRLKAMDRLKRFKCKVLVSSDLTARGIDAENVDLVINFDLSYTSEVYMHRVGRAGRYGSIGVAISIIDEKEIGNLQRIEKTGSFKTYKLPDPIPKDIILYPPEVDYVIDDADGLEAKKSTTPDNIEYDALSDNGYDLEETNIENIKVKGIFGTSADNALVKSTTQDDGVDIKPCDDTSKFSGESEMEIKKIDENGKNVETIHLNGQTTVENLKNGCICDDSIKQKKNENSSFLKDCDQNEIVNGESVDEPYACDIHKNSDDFCDKTALENQDMINNIESDVQLNTEFFNVNYNIEMEDLEKDCKNILTDADTGNAPETKNILKNMQSESVNCELESVDKSNNTLNDMIKAFIETFESNKKVESTLSKTTFDKDHQVNINSAKEFITVDMINNLKSQKHEFFYKTFKKFQENKDASPTAHKNENESKKEKNIGDNSNPDLVDEDMNIVPANLEENSKFDSKDVFLEKPNFESTPQVNCKNKQTTNLPVDEPCKSTIQNHLIQLFQEVSDESDSDDLESNGAAKQNSTIDAASDSASSDSEEGSDSESSSSLSESSSDNSDSSSTTSSSGNEDEGTYHHNYSRTGRQNPSLISDSMSDHLRNDRFYYDHYFPNHKCVCCCVPVNDMPQRSTARFPGMLRHRKKGHKFDQNCHSGDLSYFKRIVENPPNRPYNFIMDSVCPERFSQMAGRREQNFPGNVTRSYFPKKHSKCHRSKNSFRCTKEEVQNRHDHLVCQRSRHQHALSCFLPTEHRCHPNRPDYLCEQGPSCELWYKTFCNQWLHIQNVIH